MPGSSSFVVGLAANLGCSATPSATCQPQSGGPEGFIGARLSSLDIAGPTNPDIVMPPIAQPAEIPLPASFPLFASGLVGVGLLGWRINQQHSLMNSGGSARAHQLGVRAPIYWF
jgi:hypothetical protein